MHQIGGGRAVGEGQQANDIVEAYGLSLHGEKQSVEGKNQELGSKVEEGIKQVKGAR